MSDELQRPAPICAAGDPLELGSVRGLARGACGWDPQQLGGRLQWLQWLPGEVAMSGDGGGGRCFELQALLKALPA